MTTVFILHELIGLLCGKMCGQGQNVDVVLVWSVLLGKFVVLSIVSRLWKILFWRDKVDGENWTIFLAIFHVFGGEIEG